MMEKINVAKLLKNCPKGMELNCVMWDNVTFIEIEYAECVYIVIKTPCGQIKLSQEGCFTHNCNNAKCVIFPKGKTTWEGFQRPFKDGDVVTSVFQGVIQGTGIFDYEEQSEAWIHACINYRNQFFTEGYLGYVHDLRFATEEEKQKLFQAIKDNGYNWNAETKALEKLNKPKFKVGDKIKNKNTGICDKVTKVHKDCYLVTSSFDEQATISFDIQDNWELVPEKFDITTLTPFESKVLVRDNKTETWKPAYWGFYDETNNVSYPYIIVGGSVFGMSIPYENNEHLLGTTDDCDEFYKTWK